MTANATRRIGTTTAADILGVTDETVRAEIRRGRLPAIRVGRCLRVLESDLEAYIAAASAAVGIPASLRVTACEHEAGAEVRIAGPSGSGKSSLVREMRGLWGAAVVSHENSRDGEVLRLATTEVAPTIAEVIDNCGLPERFECLTCDGFGVMPADGAVCRSCDGAGAK